MNGVEILSSTEVASEFTYNWWLAGLMYLAVILVWGIIGFYVIGEREEPSYAFFGCLLGAIIGIFIWFCVCVLSEKPTAYETHYKVTIDDSVSMNEFLDKYEILDQEGKIYTVKERE